MREPETSTPAAMRNAAEERSPGTRISSRSSSSHPVTATRLPRRSMTTPARSSSRSVWSRDGEGSVTATSPSAVSPASSTQDLTCAEATGIS